MGELTPEDLIKLEKAFRQFDRDSSGKISVAELGTIVRIFGLNPSQEDIRRMIDEVDADRTGDVCFAEFAVMIAMHMTPADKQADDLRKAFRIFDKDGDGFLTVEELRYAMINLGEPLTDLEIEEMILEADEDGDGMINYEEYIKMLQ